MEFSRIFIFDRSSHFGLSAAGKGVQVPWKERTIVESFQFVTGCFRPVHAVEHGLEPCIIFAPEVVGNYQVEPR